MRRGPLWDGILGEQVVGPAFALGPSGNEVNEGGMDRRTPLADFSFFCGLKVNNPASQSLARRSTMASRRAPVRAAIIIRSRIAGLAGPVRSLRTSSSVKGRSSSSCGVAGSGPS